MDVFLTTFRFHSIKQIIVFKMYLTENITRYKRQLLYTNYFLQNSHIYMNDIHIEFRKKILY